MIASVKEIKKKNSVECDMLRFTNSMLLLYTLEKTFLHDDTNRRTNETS